ncbi:MAG: phosphotransferase [Solirubrobacteraceae bacterium]|nr:phosphotransferase [Solirubrobacteraceae bacterium]
MISPALLRTVDELTSTWLADVLGRPGLQVDSTTAIGTGQMSQSHRVRFTVDGEPGTVVVKVASADPNSRGTGVGMGAYYREISFYREMAERIGGPLPRCHLAEYDEQDGWFTLVLEDVVGATQGDQIAGCGIEDARAAMLALARLHAPVLGDLALGTEPFLNLPNPLTQDLLAQLLPGFLDRYGDRIAPEHQEVCRRFVAVADAWTAARRPPMGLVHGDFRLDNLLFRDGACTVVDWQTMAWGPAMTDAAYFVGGALTDEDRREHEESLVRLYHDEVLGQGVTGFTWEECWEGYRESTFFGLVMTIVASMVVERTERGDEMFMRWLARNAQQVIDLDAVALLPDADDAVPEPLRPDPEDDGAHAPGPEEWWNESWYFDAVSDAADLGVYTRIGRLPNRDEALFTACVCGPDRPSTMLVGHFPLPALDDPSHAIDVPGLQVEHHCEVPLERYRVTVRGTARSHDDPSAPLRHEEGEPVEIDIDLTWHTAGTPYRWRRGSRYEIPCRVTGTVRVGDEELTLEGPGQRDHSWGTRDWWAVDWMWSGLHLADGTHTHLVTVPRIPGQGMGYVQRDGELTEITVADSSYESRADGLTERAVLDHGPGLPKVTVEPLAWGALRMDAPDGRVSHFPRAMCRVTDEDGREGTGWIEWNRVQGSDA